MRHQYRSFLALVVSLALGSATAAGQTLTPVEILGGFGQLYPEDEWLMTDPVTGTCWPGQTCPQDPQQLSGFFNAPNDVAIDVAGRVVVADTSNHRVQVFGHDGAHQFTIGGLGSFGVPQQWVPVFPGYEGDRVDPVTGETLDLRFFYPWSVAVDATLKIVIADYLNHRIAILHPDGRLFHKFGEYADVNAGPVTAELGRFSYPNAVLVRPGTRLGDPMDLEGRLWVLEQGNNRVQVFDAMLRPRGAFVAVIADAQRAPFYPTDLAYDPVHDRLLVVEPFNGVQVFTTDGVFQFEFSGDDLAGAIAISVDLDGRIYVADYFDRIHVYEQDGSTVRHAFDFGGSGETPGQFSYPSGVSYGYGRMVVADQVNHRIQIFDVPGSDTIPPVSAADLYVVPNEAGWVNVDQTVTFTATDAGSGVETIVVDYVEPDRPPMYVQSGTSFAFSEGVYVIDYYAIDRAGNREQGKRVEIRVDKTAPSLTCSSTTLVIWPANHKLVPVSFNLTSIDSLSGSGGYVLSSARSSEPDNGLGDGDQPNDLQDWTLGVADTVGFVRAERSGKGAGRVYSFEFESRDQAGNVATCGVASVTVPHSNGK
jgi:hypothetical protein